jgi:hypothetical protein
VTASSRKNKATIDNPAAFQNFSGYVNIFICETGKFSIIPANDCLFRRGSSNLPVYNSTRVSPMPTKKRRSVKNTEKKVPLSR